MILGWVCLSLLALGCASNGYNKGQFNLYSIDEEKKMGDDFAQQLLDQYQKKGKVYNDKQVNNMVKRIGSTLAQHAPENKFSYHFYVIESRQVNAFAVPGGHVFIFTGLINYCQNEAELAGVVGHEMGHIISRHGTEQMSKQLAVGVAGAVVGVGLAGVGVDPSIAQMAVNAAETGMFLSYSRKDETEADDLGACMVYKAGYHPEGMKNFFDRLHKKQGDMSDLEVFMSTHPDPGDRETHIHDLIKELGPTDKLKWDSKDFKNAKAKVAKIQYPQKKDK